MSNPINKDLSGSILNNYYVKHKLNKGVFGNIYLCNTNLVIKQYIPKFIEYKKHALKEINILKNISNSKSPNKKFIIEYIDSFIFDNEYYLILEHLHIDLYNYMKLNDNMIIEETKAIKFIYQICKGLELIHTLVIHADLKPENIMITPNNDIKIIDFGNSILKHKIYSTNYIVSRYYRAPEICFELPYTSSIDIWSVGCIYYELLTGKPIFKSSNHLDLVFRMCEKLNIPNITDYKLSSYFNTYFKYNDYNNTYTYIQTSNTHRKIYKEPKYTLDIFLNDISLTKINKKYTIQFLKSIFTYDWLKRPTAEECTNYLLFLNYKVSLVNNNNI